MPILSADQAQPTRLVDQEEALETIGHRLSAEGVRLLTLTGPVGVGKTRLAIEAGMRLAENFSDGVAFVELSLVATERVFPAIAQALGIAERDDRRLLDVLTEYVRGRRILLILDGFERVLLAAGQLAELLAVSRGLVTLVTSRVPLHLRWEQMLRIHPLAVPDMSLALPSLDQLAHTPAVTLFLERVQALNPDFILTDENARAVGELCMRLDGLPLAIELAAARTRFLSPQMILERLEQRLSLLQWQALDLPERQRSLGTAIGWSYDLLAPDEQALFRHLGIFVGGFDLEAAEVVLGGIAGHPVNVLDGLALLVDNSLVQVTGQGEEFVRYSLLESIREFALEQLAEQGELETAGRVHATYFIQLAERGDHELRGRSEIPWFLRLEQERNNLDAALHWLLAHGEPEAALGLATTLGYFWAVRGYHAEGRQWLEGTLREALNADPGLRTRALLCLGGLGVYEGNVDRARESLEEAQRQAQERQDSRDSAHALSYLGVSAILAGDGEQGTRLLQEARGRWEVLGDVAQIAFTLGSLGLASFKQGDFEHAAALYSDALARLQAIGDVRTSAAVRFGLALAFMQLGDIARAVQLVQDGMHEGMILQDRWLIGNGANAALVLAGELTAPEQRARLLGAVDSLRVATGFTAGVWEHFSHGSLARLHERLEREGWGEAYRQRRAVSPDDVSSLALAILGDVGQTLAAADNAEEPLGPFLSERETEVLQLVADGLSSKEIGQQLYISPSTVSYHLSSIFRKLAVDNRAQAVAMAVQHGLL